MGKMPLLCYLLPREDREYTKCYPILSVGTIHRLNNQFLMGNFTGVPIMNFIPDWESDIVNKPGLKLLRRKESSLEKKIVSTKDFIQASQNLVRKRNVYRMRVVT